ncbi:MAG TPA: trypsin-like peptidase domain-containing protein, partial [Clostridia bacterium]|nr:trypsin-like peptidase domain-containing protein [Clostridia bacterium]
MDNKGFFYYEDRSNVPYNRNKRKGENNAALIAFIIVGALLISVLSAVVGSVVAGKRIEDARNTQKAVVIYKSETDHPLSDKIGTGQPLSVSQIVNIAKHSVVEIKTETTVYGGFYGNYIASGAGSGVIISDDGHIITNHHVISGADTITITLADGSVSAADVIGVDEKTDLAVVKLAEDFDGLIPAIIGDSSKLVVGQSVVAIGNPLGSLGGTVTDGILSAVQRRITVDGLEMELLQTNAAVNPGNSGGGLFNCYGELIGIVNAKSSDVSIEGIGFAIPSSVADYVAKEIIEKGYVPGRPDYNALPIVEINTIPPFSVYPKV